MGEINFPNLKVQVDTLDFGCVLTDTLERRYFTITNVSSVPAAYEWSLAMQPEEDVKERKQGPVYLPPGEVFDILPVHGTLAPGASERIEATYYANPNACSSCWAVCNVTGGPSYEVRLSAESSHIRFSIDRHHVDIGRQQYNRAIDTEVCLQVRDGRGRDGWLTCRVDALRWLWLTRTVIPVRGACVESLPLADTSPNSLSVAICRTRVACHSTTWSTCPASRGPTSSRPAPSPARSARATRTSSSSRSLRASPTASWRR